jgi:uncharacterized protein (TIGR02145 family)
LVTFEIGADSENNGISAIDWSIGPYFIKTEIDPAGSTNYTITGTSQLLSVPYALYTKTSGTSNDAVKITGDQTIAGNKTFSGAVLVNTPVNANDAANKAYVDQLSLRIDALEETVNKYGTMMDSEGNVYKTVIIGDQVWMAENLKNKRNLIYPDLDSNTFQEYGSLFRLNNDLGCPVEWHVPSDNEWKELEVFLGMDPSVTDSFFYRGTNEADKLKTNGSTGFNVVFPGSCNISGGEYSLCGGFGKKAFFICSGILHGIKFMNLMGDFYIYRSIDVYSSKIYRGAFGAYDRYPPFYSVRCLKD